MNQDPDDVRTKMLSQNNGLCYKFMYNNGESSSRQQYGNIKVFRLSETYLIAAECAVELGDQAKAREYLNAIVERGNPSNTVTGNVTVDRVYEERHKELVGENHRFFDLMRRGMTCTRTGSDHLATVDPNYFTFNWDSYKIVLPVPLNERNANENLNVPEQQNPGYIGGE